MEFYPSILKHANHYFSASAAGEKPSPAAESISSHSMLSEAGKREQKKHRADSEDSKSPESRTLQEDSGASTSTSKTPSLNSK